jgi:hypothetical protein
MGHLFYLIGIFILIAISSNLINFGNYHKIRKWIQTFKKVTQKDPQVSDFREKKDHEIYVTYNSISVIEFFWYMIGITSNSWYVFTCLILLNLIFNVISFGLPSGLFGKTLLRIFLVIKIFVVLILILNHFHFHKDWLQLFFTD